MENLRNNFVCDKGVVCGGVIEVGLYDQPGVSVKA